MFYFEDQADSLAEFYLRNPHCKNFIPLAVPNPHKLTAAQIAQHWSFTRHIPDKQNPNSGLKVMDFHSWTYIECLNLAYAYCQKYYGCLPNDWVLMAWSHEEIVPNWQLRFNYLAYACAYLPHYSEDISGILLNHIEFNPQEQLTPQQLEATSSVKLAKNNFLELDEEFITGQAGKPFYLSQVISLAYFNFLFSAMRFKTLEKFAQSEQKIYANLVVEVNPNLYALMPSLATRTKNLEEEYLVMRNVQHELQSLAKAYSYRHPPKPAISISDTPFKGRKAKPLPWQKERQKQGMVEIADFSSLQTINQQYTQVASVDSSEYNELKIQPNAISLCNPQPYTAIDLQQAQSGIRDHIRGMRKFVINLDRNPERLASFKDNPEVEEFVRVPAIDGKALSPEQIAASFDQELFHKHYLRYATVSEIGCALSHQQILLNVLADASIGDNEFVLIAEDDIVLYPTWYGHVNEMLEALLPNPVHNIIALNNVMRSSSFKLGDIEQQVKSANLNYDPSIVHTVNNLPYLGKDRPALPILTHNNARNTSLVGVKEFTPRGGGFYLVRKRAIRENQEMLTGKCFWLADDFALILKHPSTNELAFGLPIFCYQNYSKLPSNLEEDRKQSELNQLKLARRNPLDKNQYYQKLDKSLFYVLQHSLSREEILQKYPGMRIITKPDIQSIKPEILDKHIDFAALSQHLVRAPSEEEISDLIMMRTLVHHVEQEYHGRIQMIFCIRDDQEFNKEILKKVSKYIYWVSNRGTLMAYYGTLGAPGQPENQVMNSQEFKEFTGMESFEHWLVSKEDNMGVDYHADKSILPSLTAFWFMSNKIKLAALQQPSKYPAAYLQNYFYTQDEHEIAFANPPVFVPRKD
ncbi:glycosyltransferase family 25 protein [Psittacicella hinzii]|uniref:Glycosyl transferase family 25 domain-containing protein n=1 Tax=Psittacicella hinzii TaxID=2028575 RepID=A0A3A1YQY8_9GAMM|nr:glycosyltransferase family 25 protein [Psittacicella hinzii]RIY38824.1 hypothetical protein CKF58_03345 [Psittacicella hinzii]